MTRTTGQHNQNPAVSECIDNCLDCHLTCLNTMSYGIAKGGKYAEGALIDQLSACADICAKRVDALTHAASLHSVTIDACAERCRRCATACDALGDDAQMVRCAQACRRCAQSCDAIAGHQRWNCYDQISQCHGNEFVCMQQMLTRQPYILRRR